MNAEHLSTSTGSFLGTQIYYSAEISPKKISITTHKSTFWDRVRNFLMRQDVFGETANYSLNIEKGHIFQKHHVSDIISILPKDGEFRNTIVKAITKIKEIAQARFKEAQNKEPSLPASISAHQGVAIESQQRSRLQNTIEVALAIPAPPERSPIPAEPAHLSRSESVSESPLPAEPVAPNKPTGNPLKTPRLANLAAKLMEARQAARLEPYEEDPSLPEEPGELVRLTRSLPNKQPASIVPIFEGSQKTNFESLVWNRDRTKAVTHFKRLGNIDPGLFMLRKDSSGKHFVLSHGKDHYRSKEGQSLHDFIHELQEGLKDKGVNLTLLVPPSRAELRSKLRIAARKLGQIRKGVSEGLKPLGEYYWLEAMDPHHRYARWLRPYFRIWRESSTDKGFFEWLRENRDAFSVKPTEVRRVVHLSEEQRNNYVAKVVNGEIRTAAEGSKPLNGDYVFVIGKDKTFYVGKYERGRFSHGSLLGGKPVIAAGMLRFTNGKLVTFNDKSGHYNKTDPKDIQRYIPDDENVKRGIEGLEGLGLDLSGVQISYHVLATPRHENPPKVSYATFRQRFPKTS